MLSVKINNKWVEMFPGTSLKYIFNSPAFSEGKAVVGDFSYSLSFPDNEVNALIFGFISNPDLYDQTSEHKCELYEENTLFVSGVYRVTSTEKGEKISGNFINSAYDFINQIKNKTTKDLDLGGDHEFLGSAEYDVYLVAMMNGSYPDYNFAQFPILNETYLDGTPEETAWQDILYINPYNPGGADVYYPYLAYLVQQIFDLFDYSVNDAFGEDDELKKLCLIGLLEDNHIVEYIGYNLHYHVLKVDLTKLLDAINSTFATAFFFNHKTKNVSQVFLKDLLTSSNYVDWTDKVLEQPKKKIDYEDRGYLLSHEFDSSDTTMGEMQLPRGALDTAEIETSVLTPLDLPAYPNMGAYSGEIRFVTCEDTYYIIADIDPELTINMQWTRLTWNFFGKAMGDALNERTSKLTTLGMYWHSKKAGSYRDGWMTPHSDQTLMESSLSGALAMIHQGNTNDHLAEAKVSDFEPRVLFFRNMRPNVNDVEYPLGTSGKYDAKGNVIGTQTLNWAGTGGLYETYWKDWLTFLDQGVPYEVPVELGLLDILELDFTKKVKIGSNFYLIKRIALDLPIEKAAIATIMRI